MNLWFRILLVWLRASLAPREHWDKPFQVSFRVWPTDLDVNLHMNNARYLALMDLGRFDMLLRTGMWKWLRQEKLMPVIASAMVRFRKPVHLFEQVTLSTRFMGFDKKWMFIEHRMERRGELVCMTIVKAAFLGTSGPVLPAQVAKVLGLSETSQPLPTWLQGWLDAEYAASQGEKAA